MTVTGTAQEELAAVADMRAGGDGDAVDGVRPQLVVSVDGTETASKAMQVAAAHGLHVVARGSGSALGEGAAPSAVDVVLDVSPANQVLEHAAGDLVMQAQAGTPLAAVRETVAGAGQQLALDQPASAYSPTLGGIIATGACGPGRQLYGSVRDLLIGITVVLADGTVASSGGKVVKNVAGYDLGKLYTGSFGTLGVITEAVFRLHPIAPETCWITRTAADERAAADAVRALRRSRAAPTAIEVHRDDASGPIAVVARLDGMAEATGRRGQRLAAEVDGAVVDAPPSWWGAMPGECVVRVSGEYAALGDVLAGIREVAESFGIALEVNGSAGVGVLQVGLPTGLEPEFAARTVEALRAVARRCGGVAVVSRASSELKAAVDVWGPVDPGALTLMHRLKEEFDPEHRLAPGRFVGGI